MSTNPSSAACAPALTQAADQAAACAASPRAVSRLACAPHEVDLWLSYYHEVSEAAQQTRLRLLLNDAERAQEARFYFPDDRLRYLVTRALVRTVLSRYVPVAPAAWEFTTNAWGRPQTAPHHQLPTLQFNISHTRGLIAMAVSTNGALGVDVENLAARAGSAGIAGHFFSPAEASALGALPTARQQQRFYEYWTLKESYIKARGMGLSLPLDGFSFAFPGDQGIALAFDADFDDSDPERWCFWQWQPGPDHLLALCAQYSGAAVPSVQVRSVIPLGSATTVQAQWCRTSASVRSRW